MYVLYIFVYYTKTVSWGLIFQNSHFCFWLSSRNSPVTKHYVLVSLAESIYDEFFLEYKIVLAMLEHIFKVKTTMPFQ